MDLMFIASTAYIKTLGSQGNKQLGLSHLIDRDVINFYEKVLCNTRQEIILDNGTFELGFPEGIDSLISKAIRIKATHFFAPDFLFDAKKTLEALKNTIYTLKKRKINNLKIAAVVQGSTEEEWLWLYDEYQKIPEVDLIGLSCLAIPRCFGKFNQFKRAKQGKYIHNDNEITSCRITLMEKLIKRGENNKNCHLLGLGDGIQDVIYANENCPWIISNDSSSAFWNAMQGKKILNNGNIEGGKTKIKVNFSFNSATKEQLELAQYNIDLYKKLLK